MFDLLHNKEYRDLNRKHALELLVFLSHNSDSFDITANIQGINFHPKLPKSIYDSFQHFVLFTLSNYTLESLKIYGDYITFEAGFGAENFGSLCTISADAIFQISKDNSIVFINPNATIEREFLKKEFDMEEQQERSKKAFRFKK